MTTQLKYPIDIRFERPFILFHNIDTPTYIYTYMPESMAFQDGGSYGDIQGGIIGTGIADTVKGDMSLEEQTTAANSLASGSKKEATVAAIISSLGKSVGIDGGPLSVTAAQGGVAINPNSVLQFTNNQIRSYQYELNLVPESEKEAIEIRNIVKAFRLSAYATKQGKFVLNYPDKWRVYFKAGGSMPVSTSTLYLTTVNAVYNGEGAMTHQNNIFNSVKLSLTFQETTVLHREEIASLEGV